MSNEDIKDAMKAGVKEAVTELMKNHDPTQTTFYVERERHWKHHEFVDEVIDFMSTVKKTTARTVIAIIIIGTVGLLVTGVVVTLFAKAKGGIG